MSKFSNRAMAQKARLREWKKESLLGRPERSESGEKNTTHARETPRGEQGRKSKAMEQERRGSAEGREGGEITRSRRRK